MNWRKTVISSMFCIGNNKIPAYINEILEVERLSRDEIEQYQREKLKTLLLHAYRNVPYYREILSAAEVVTKESVQLDNFDRIPVLTKDIIRDNYYRLTSDDLKNRRWYSNTSGGSTGEPVRFIQDQMYQRWNIANKIYLKTYEDQNLGDREIRLWGSERDILEGKEKFSIRLRNWLYNRREFNTFLVSDTDMHRFINEWNTFKPRWVEAYVQSIYDFACFIMSQGLEVTSPRGILTTAGTLYPKMKDTIEEVFRCKTYNRYGSREVGDVACSCSRQEGLHVCMWNHYLEILDDIGHAVLPGQMGTVYVTLLSNYAMPLIRYQVGDIAMKSEDKTCSCGRGMPLIAKIVGRDVSIFRTKDGKKVDGEYFTHLFYFRDWVRKFQVIQDDYNVIEIKVVLRSEKRDNEMTEIEKAIRVVMGTLCTITWTFVDEIPPLKSGKFLYTISNLK